MICFGLFKNDVRAADVMRINMTLVVHVMALWKQTAAAYPKPLIKSVVTEDLLPDFRNNFVPKIYCTVQISRVTWQTLPLKLEDKILNKTNYRHVYKMLT
jgi:hypothetical protein